MRVLYAAHTGLVGGGERSLLDLLELLPDGIDPIVACPRGALAERVEQMGIPVLELPEVGGLGRGSASIALAIARAGTALERRAVESRADVIHAVSLRAGLAAVVARRLGGPPFVVDIRDCLDRRRSLDLAQRLLARGATSTIANSHYTATRFHDVTGVMPHVSHPLVDVDAFASPPVGRREARLLLGVPAECPALAVVGQLTPWKAQDDAVRILREVRVEHPEAVLLLCGTATFTAATRHDNEAFSQSLRSLAADLGLAGQVRFLGDRDDVSTVLAASDLLLVPSWEEPFGRVVVEGMAAGVPVLATSVGGPAEILGDGAEGLLLAPRDPSSWARAAIALFADDARRDAITVAASDRARRFQLDRAARMATITRSYAGAARELPVSEALSVV
jgi:glycosyltransferase involved in cell wall biosynthesis